ncbi:MAG TPA: sulfite oxidase-like oxidoreductase [Azospira sp.]|nr:sulfite oxidase-like oxidoreductase [Azospira sp.]
MSTNRIPPGQRQVSDFPVLDLGLRPEVSHDNWQLRLFGLVAEEVCLDWDALLRLPQVQVTSDFHCVTTWSQLDMGWEGVLARDVVALAGPLTEARFVTLHSYDGYTTNLPLAALLDDDVLVAHGLDGGPLAYEHGGPVRLVVPKRYGWKSAKWLSGIEFTAADQPGYWEVRGYHNEADPWKEERYSE